MPDHYAVMIGSGFAGFASATGDEWAETRFGVPSAPLKSGTISGRRVLTLARHGDEHTIPPHAINYRANLTALQEAGVTAVIAVNTVGVISSLREPGEIAIPDQLLDYTWGRQHTIYDTFAHTGGGNGSGSTSQHIDFTEPFSRSLRRALLDAATSIDCYDGGTYAATQGPRLETAAEVDRLERDGADYVGMTAMPEASIARELGMHYACIALIVNRAAGRGTVPIHDDVESSILMAKAQTQSLLQSFFESL